MLAEEKVQQEKIFSKFGKSCGWVKHTNFVAMALAVLMLSPVTIRTVMPALWHCLIEAGTSGLTGSWINHMSPVDQLMSGGDGASPQCRRCRRRSCLRSHCPPPSPRSLAPLTSRNEPENVSRLTGSWLCWWMFSAIPEQIWAKTHLILLSLGGDKVPVGQADRSQAVLCHGLNHSLDQPEKTVWHSKYYSFEREAKLRIYSNLSWWWVVKLSTLPFSANRKLHFFITISDAPFVYTLEAVY